MFQHVIPSLSSSNEIHNFERPYPQAFSIPYTCVRYMAKNPFSGKAWKKLIQTCKYFWPKYPIYPVGSLRISTNNTILKWAADERTFTSKNVVPKLWLCDRFFAHNLRTASFIAENLLSSKMFIWNIQKISLDNQALTLEEYQIITSSGRVKIIRMYGDTAIVNSMGKIVTFDVLLENLQNIEFITCCSDLYMFKSDTVIKMVKILSNFKKLTFLGLYSLRERFDFSSFTEYLKKNEKVNVELFFNRQLSVEYKVMLKDFISDVVENPPTKIPRIRFPGYDKAQFKEYEKLLQKDK